MYDDQYLLKLQEIYHYLELGRTSDAMSNTTQLLAVAPNEGELLFIMASCLHALEREEEAIKYCSQAMSSGYSLEKCNYQLGIIHMNLMKYYESEQCFLNVLSSRPDDVNTLATYGFLMLLTGFEKKAEYLIEEAMKLDPENSIALQYEFYLELIKNKKFRKVQTVSKLMQTSNNEIVKLINLSLLNMFGKKYKDAREYARQAFLLDPANTDVLSALQEIDRATSIFFILHRLIDRVGGMTLITIIGFIIAVILGVSGYETISGYIILSYFALVTYSIVLYFGNMIKNYANKNT